MQQPGSVLPGGLGKNVVALHSSWFKEQAGKYTEGKYDTVGQILATLEGGDEVSYFVKAKDGGYDRFDYIVDTVGVFTPEQADVLYPEK